MVAADDAGSRLGLGLLDHLRPRIDRDLDASVLSGVAPHILGHRVARNLLDLVRHKLFVMEDPLDHLILVIEADRLRQGLIEAAAELVVVVKPLRCEMPPHVVLAKLQLLT